MKPICFRLQAFSPCRQLLQFFVFVLAMFVGTGFAQQNLPNPLPDLSFQLAFRADGDGKLTTKQYTLAGPAGGGLLYGGLRFVQAGESLYFATERQDVYRFDAQTGVFEGIELGAISPQMAQEGWPMGFGYDRTRQRAVLVSLGGEGFIHAYSTSDKKWSLVSSMDNWDFDCIEHHAHNDSFYGVELSHQSSPGDLVTARISRLSATGAHGTTIQIPNLPFGIGHGNHEAELVSVGEHLVLLLEPGRGFNDHGQSKESRIYLIKPATGEFTLTYRKIWEQWPLQNAPSTEFELHFYPTSGLSIGQGQVFTRRYGPNGPIDEGRLLPGMHVVPNAYRTTWFGTHWHEVYKINGDSGSAEKMTFGTNVPELSWPMGVAFDGRGNRILLVSLGGEGFLYAYSLHENRWSVVASMEQTDFDSILFHPGQNVIFAVGHDGHLHKLNTDGKIIGRINLPSTGLHIGPGGYQTAMAVAGSRIALLVEPDSPNEIQPGQESRIYLIDIENGTAELTYRKVWSSTPQTGTLEITAPQNGSFYPAGQSIELRATASHPSVRITSVDFYAGEVKIGSSQAPQQSQTFLIEAEDFDFNGGYHQTVTDTMPYYGGAHQGRSATHNVDYARDFEVPDSDIYRVGEIPNAPMIPFQEASALGRGSWTMEVNYRLGWITESTWFNYTRDFPPGQYTVYAGLSHGATDPGIMRGTLAKVVGGIGTSSQTLEHLGNFSGNGSGAWTSIQRVALMNNGQPVSVELNGPMTLRFTGASGDYDYLLLENQTRTVGGVVNLSFSWNNVPAGTHIITARATLPNGQRLVSRPVQITVGSPPGRTVVQVTATDAEATEYSLSGNLFDPARFAISRTGDLTTPRTVLFSIHGTAKNGEDYETIPTSVTIPAGRASTEIQIIPRSDSVSLGHHYEVVLEPGISWEAARTKAEQSTFNGVKGHLATVTSAEEDAHIESLRQAAAPGGFGEVWLGGYQTSGQSSPTTGWLWINGEGPIPTPTATANSGAGYSNWQPGEPNDYWGSGSENYLTTGFSNIPGWNDEGMPSHGGGYVIEYDTPGNDADEKMETVGIRLESGPVVYPVNGVVRTDQPIIMPAYDYEIDPAHRQAGAVIYERQPPTEGALEIVIPRAEWIYHAGEAIEFMAAAWHPFQDLLSVHYFIDGQSIGSSFIDVDKTTPGGLLIHSLKWSSPASGRHVLQAKTELANDLILASSQIPFVVEGGTLAPTVKLVHPADGASFIEGNPIEIRVEATDRDGNIQQIELVADGNVLQRSQSSPLVFTWRNVSAGQHTLVARTTDNTGVVGSSAHVRILVRRVDNVAFVLRALPDAYSPGIPFTVELRATPSSGTRAYAVEDVLPAGWQASNISHDGALDALTGKVKFGPFTDAQPRTLTYRLIPPAGATGPREFTGNSSIDGAPYPIGGDRIIDSATPFHPADTDQNYSIGLLELTAYAADWKAGRRGVQGLPIPQSYVTRAAMLWKGGEAYQYDSRQGLPPFCWAPLTPIPLRTQLSSAVANERLMTTTISPGLPSQVRVSIAPPAAIASYTVEEKIPTGWSVSNISHDGAFDAQSGRIRWGVFFDSNSRTLSYFVTAPPNITTSGHFSGQISFDGEVREISGAPHAVTSVGSTPIRLAVSETDASDGIRVQVFAAPGQTGIVESSSDLIHWTEIHAIFLPDGLVEISDRAAPTERARFYRFRAE